MTNENSPQYDESQQSAPVEHEGSRHTAAAAPARNNSLATISIIAGILGLTATAPLSGSIIAVVFGHVAKRQISETGERGSGFAKAGLILGYIGLLLILLAIVGLGAFFAGVESITVEDGQVDVQQ